MPRSDPAPASASPGFTLVELILVMALLALVMAFAAPSLARSMRGRNLNQEAVRFLSLIEYGRDEAISQGVPMVVWIDPRSQRFGVEADPAFAAYAGEANRARDYAMNKDIHFEVAQAVKTGTLIRAVRLMPDGSPDPSSAPSVRLVDRDGSSAAIARTGDGWSYAILKEGR